VLILEDDFLSHQGLLSSHLVLIVLVHQVLVLTVLADTRPFIRIIVPSSFAEMVGADCFTAELAEFKLIYHCFA
jgi:hypothetical protein